MRILIVSHMFPSYRFPVERSGVFVENLADALRKKGHEIEVISPVASPGFLKIIRKDLNWYRHSEELPPEDNYNGFKTKYPRYLSPNIAWKPFFAYLGNFMARGIAKTFAQSIREFNPDIIHAHTLMPDTAAVLNLKQKLNLDIPVISTVHGGEITYPLGIETFSDRPDSSDYPFYMKRMEKAISRTDGIITVSDKLRGLMKHYWKGNYRTIYNGISQEWFDCGEHGASREKEIITVGALIDRKRITMLSSVFSDITERYPEWKLRIIGEGPKREEIERRFAGLIEDNRIIIMGNVPNEQVRDYMRRASIFALPSVREPFGVVFIEAMASCLPVIGCSDGGPSEIISHNTDGILIEPDNREQLKLYIEKLITNSDWRANLGGNAYLKAKSKFSWQKIAAETIDFYSYFL